MELKLNTLGLCVGQFGAHYSMDTNYTLSQDQCSQKSVPLWRELDRKEGLEYSNPSCVQKDRSKNMPHKEYISQIILLREESGNKATYEVEDEVWFVINKDFEGTLLGEQN